MKLVREALTPPEREGRGRHDPKYGESRRCTCPPLRIDPACPYVGLVKPAPKPHKPWSFGRSLTLLMTSVVVAAVLGGVGRAALNVLGASHGVRLGSVIGIEFGIVTLAIWYDARRSAG